jgi:hypothetical protein
VLSTDSGAHWQRTNPDGPLSGPTAVTPESFVTADGAHVMLLQEGDTFVLRVSADGKTYAPLTAVGGPTKLAIPPATIDERHYLLYNGQTLYLSNDGRSWRQVTAP